MQQQNFIRLFGGPVAIAILGIAPAVAPEWFPTPIPGAAGLLLVMLATYIGGLASGLLTSAIAVCIAAIALSTPGQLFTLTHDAAMRLTVLVFSAPLMALIVALVQARMTTSLAIERAQRQQLEADNRELETLRAAIDQINLGVMLLDGDLRARFISRAMLRVGGLPENAADGAPTLRSLLEFGCETGVFSVPPEKRSAYIDARIAQVQAGDPRPRELQLSNGEIARMQCAILPDGGRLITYTLVTDLVRQAEELKNLRGALDQIDYGIVLLDPQLRVEFINRAAVEQGGVNPPQAGKTLFEEMCRQVAKNGVYAIKPEELESYVASRMAWVGGENPAPYDIPQSNGRITRVSCIVLRDGARMLTYYDVTDTVRHVGELEERASVDPMTGLNNRRYFEDAGKQEWERSQRYRRPLSLLMIDIDRFKTVNDRFGHAAGDEALREVAGVCREGKRETDILARIGGEEFALLLPETGLDQAMAVAERIRQALESHPIMLGQHRQSLTISVGVAEASPGMADLQALMKQADLALYGAKRGGRNRVMTLQPNNARPASAA